ncbi:hypothetical protein F5Y14DRAFT_438905 [Nemania sp. NC0429]|nr:hypothetical protein F5Y14DRAFT_438905 [Nemania sp. NC0429]
MSKGSFDQKKALALLSKCNAEDNSSTQYSKVDSAIDMTFPASVRNDLAQFEASESRQRMDSAKTTSPVPSYMANAPYSPVTPGGGVGATPNSPIVLINGMPYTHQRIMEMGQVLAQARRERMFPSTITPTYNVQAVIDDFEDLQRLNAAREGATDTRDDAFRPDVSRIYIEIQRRIQDRDLTYGEVAADSNVRARLNGFANGTAAETGMYNLMRHAMNSVLRLNNLTTDSEKNIVDAVATRVVSDIRATVQSHAAHGTHGVDGVNMNDVMEQVFSAIETSLGSHMNEQASITDAQRAQLNSMNNVTDAQNAQVNAIAGHVNAIDNHVHAMGNNVNAMSSLVNSTNGNVTALSTNIITLQAAINMIPQMASNAVRDMLPEIIGPAVEQAFQGAISNELIGRLQVFTNAMQEARARAEVNQVRQKNMKRRNWFGIFKRGSSKGVGKDSGKECVY